MKTIISSICIIGLISFSLAKKQTTTNIKSIATVNISEIYNSMQIYQETKKNAQEKEKQINSLKNKYRAILNESQKKLLNKRRQLADTSIPKKTRISIQNKLRDMITKIKGDEARYNTNLQRKQTLLREYIQSQKETAFTQIKATIKKYAAMHNIDLVLTIDRVAFVPTIIYAKKHFEITDAIIKMIKKQENKTTKNKK